tara:strand:- start:307 stop:510 length:204 start_codon:yes stop_codon:yes gene_type:complete
MTDLSEVEKLHKRINIVFHPSFDPSLNLITEIDSDWEKMPFISNRKKGWWQKFIGFFSFNWFFSPLS